ncbi:MAG: hypothetical protein LBT53_08635 [Puniceicoccales bacterium]|jgi:beta-galactosidase/beta-glucuronidase|nr:hypothetical protein [Puniceicoccales bacterium]
MKLSVCRAAVAAFVLALFPAVAPCADAAPWKPAGDRIKTAWAEKVSAECPLPEYPRPILARAEWKNLNGLWDYAVTPLPPNTTLPAAPDAAPAPTAFDGKILVPFAIESSLSGVQKTLGPGKLLWYQRDFEVPAAWDGQAVRLNFGAVDWHAEVWVNGTRVGGHKGGYTPFSFDITPHLKKAGPQRLVVRVYDGTDKGNGYQPVGKQLSVPRTIWYTPVSGIWQTVWLEPVPKENHITEVRATPDIDTGALYVDVDAAKNGRRTRVKFKVLDKTGREVVSGQGKLNNRIKVIVDNPVLWSPENPYLYTLSVTLSDNGKDLETVTSYTALRKISVAKDKHGHLRTQLNNKNVFQFGTLDQGWWPDGLYTAPTDEALLFDIKKTKAWGFNMIRKHVKVEPARWYYHCDREGMLVWQDMPSGNWPPEMYRTHYDVGQMKMDGGRDTERSKESKDNFYREWKEIIDLCRPHPSVVVWVPFNEAWGQFDTAAVAAWTKGYDPSRLVDAASGGNFHDCPDGDIHDWHNYPHPTIKFLRKNKVNVIGEYGGIAYPLKGHLWREQGGSWGYINADDKGNLTEQYVKYAAHLKTLVAKGVSGAIYTQTTDVEIEVNGIMTYDRKEVKMDEAKIRAANQEVIRELDASEPEWQPIGLRLKTPWTDNVNPAAPLPEYPRPILTRPDWQNLNGLWSYAITPKDAPRPTRWAEKKILVPFPIEAPLSGVRKNLTSEQNLWYQRDFEVPAAWAGKAVRLNFGAVDWQADVWLNDRHLGQHRGGYAPFSFDLTPHLKSGGPQRLTVRVFDPTDKGIQPRGKQTSRPDGIFYTPASGIWQTVWLEPVPKENHITAVNAAADIDNDTLAVSIEARDAALAARVDIRLLAKDGREVAKVQKAPLIGDTRLYVKTPELWSPENPYLYGLEITLYPDGKTAAETVKSYTAFRKISAGRDASGKWRIRLNNKNTFLFGPLDQGFWPDGIYTAPTDEALLFDIKKTKAWGFNMIRKHVKTEPDRWYYHCDKEGIMVWQDMPGGGESVSAKLDMRGNISAGRDAERTPESAENFKHEWREIIDLCRPHPSVVVWVPFNESWGQFDTVAIANWTKGYDPTRLVNAASGGNHRNTGDFYDHHSYPAPNTTKHSDYNRIVAIGEYGGLGLRVHGHLWERGKGWGWGEPDKKDKDGMTEKYIGFARHLRRQVAGGVSAAVYTQTTDVETEANGLMTYDRQVIKINEPAVRAANQAIINELKK